MGQKITLEQIRELDLLRLEFNKAGNREGGILTEKEYEKKIQEILKEKFIKEYTKFNRFEILDI